MRQLVCTPVELAVSHGSSTGHHGHRIGRTSGLSREQVMEQCRGSFGIRVVPLGQQLMPLGLGQQRQVPHAALR